MLQVRTPQGDRKSEVNIIVDEYNGGSNSLIDVSRQNQKMAYESINLIQSQDGIWTPRWGTSYYGVEISGEDSIDGIGVYIKDRGLSTESRELIAVGGTSGAVYKSTDGGAWSSISGATLTAGHQAYLKQANDVLYITNSYDNIIRYDGSSLISYTGLSTPTLPGTPLVRTTLTAGSYTYYYVVTALNDVGETIQSATASITVNKVRDNWTGGEKLAFTWDAVASATRYQVYISDDNANFFLLTSTTAVTQDDDGTISINEYIVPPLANSTTGPKIGPMDISGDRIWGTKVKDEPYTVYYGGTGNNFGKFTDFNGGGWVQLETGGQNVPIRVTHYRTGKGDPVTTVICSSPDGTGSIFQILLEPVTVGSENFVVPSVFKIVGSIGGDSPLGVITQGDNVIFPNKKGVYALRPRAQIFNILSTDELSVNIRPSWRSLSGANIEKIAAIFTQGKILFSVPSGTDNDRIVVYDLERNNWSDYWSIGVKQFVEYTDSSGNTHLIGVPTSGGRVWEFIEDVKSDLGSAFSTSYLSPLIPVNKKAEQQARINDAYVELGRPTGTIVFEVLGIDKNGQLVVLNSRTISSTNSLSKIDFANALFGDYEFSTDEDPAPESLARARETKYLKIREKVLAVQFHVYSTAANTNYSLNKLQASGYLVPSKPTRAMKE